VTSAWARTPLRVKLVATLVALVVAALAGAGFAATASLRSYLLQRVDAQLADAARSYAGRAGGGGGPGGRPGGPGGFGDPRLPNQYYVRDVDAAGTRTTDFGTEPVPRLPDIAYAAADGHAFTVPASRGNVEWRAVAVRSGDGGVVTVAHDLEDVQSTLTRLTRLELGIGLTVVLLLGAVGYELVRRSLRPLVEVETTAAAIAAGDLSRRVPEGDPRTEVGRLGAALNAMLHQIESAFRVREASEAQARRSEERMRRFVTDASHELRTPLTSIRGYAELYRQGAGGDLGTLMRRIEDEGARMGLLVDDLLLLARLDQERPLARDRVDLVPLAADAVHDARVVAPDRDVTLEAGVGPYEVDGDEPRLRQVLGNLVSNALKYTAGPVRVRLATHDDQVVMEVADEGPGLAPAEAERVFERFYRADAARTRAGDGEGGTGLGLAIVAALVEAHGGRAEVDTSPGHGATFRVLLPRAGAGTPLPG
jgi:two-component system OmpR family sensor kinase